ncbi:MAG: acyclic terpene utilization AtuA family protein [Candidatus Bipolaricaulota bacterium]
MEHRVLSPTAILGYGFPSQSFGRGIERNPDIIAVDAGSTDPGPYYLGAGESFTTRDAVLRDLSLLLPAAVDGGIPLIIGSAGGSGASDHVDWTVALIKEIAARLRLVFRMGIIYSDIAPRDLLGYWEAGRVRALRSVPELSAATILGTIRIVAQFGVEPIQQALSQGCQVIVCGRCYDPAPFAAAAIAKGFDPGLALHMGKILECGAIAATPGSGSDCVLGTLGPQSFTLEALDPRRTFTPLSTAAHTLYEKSDPYMLPGPGGALDLRRVRFDALDDGRVRVSGSRFVPEELPTVKLEGVRQIGYRTICIAGIRDPILISQIDTVLESTRLTVSESWRDDPDVAIIFRAYGRNGVMGSREPLSDRWCHELGLIIEAIASTQERANSACAVVRSTLLHVGYPRRKTTAGNLAFPYSPSDIECGPVYEFSIYHLLTPDGPSTLFPVQVQEVRP